jgi:ABC-2 type transport system ATP-binding protein
VEDFASLGGMKEKFLCDLSKGMKQRVSLARAVIHNPDLLILDEPAAGLDPRARIELRELLKVLAAQKKAIFISSHILTELAEVCDGAVIIEQGRLLKAGMMDTLASSQEDAKFRRIAARIPGDSQHMLHRELLTIPGVMQADIIGNEVHAQFEGDEDMCAGLLVELTKRGLRVVEFRHQQMDFEDVFMSITNGAVQ